MGFGGKLKWFGLSISHNRRKLTMVTKSKATKAAKKTAKVIDVNSFAIPAIDNVKAMSAFIRSAITAYGTAKIRIHVAACAALLAAAPQNPNADYLTMIYDGLSDKEQTMFRRWVNQMTEYTVKHAETGEPVGDPKNWIGFRAQADKTDSKKARGFFVKKDTLAYRVLDQDKLLKGERFYSMDNGNTSPEYTFEKVAAWLEGIEAQLERRLEQIEGTVPEGV